MNARAKKLLPSAVALASIIAAVVWVFPRTARHPLPETLVWSFVVLAAFGGWGWLVKRLVAKDDRVDLGLLTVWGASAMATAGGILMVASLATQGGIMALVDVGLASAAVGLIVEHRDVRLRARFVVRFARRDPRIALLVAFVGFLVGIHYMIGISEWHTNPYDDDIAYLPFMRRLLQTGSILEPFSFRRLASMGGQTFFVALTGIRAGIKQSHTFDRSICVLMVVLLVAGHRRASVLFRALVIVLFLTMQNIAINTASYYSGVAFFLGLFRTMSWLGDRARAPWKAAVPIALVAAVACTLRQNFLPVPAFALVTMHVVRFLRTRDLALRERAREPLLTAAFGVLALVPWMIGAWQSGRTFLYPVMPGNFNRALELRASAWTFVREIQLNVWTVIEGLPLASVGLFFVVGALVRERSTRKPLASLFVGTAAGFLLLSHGLSQGDAGNNARYAYGFVMAFVMASVLCAGSAKIEGALTRTYAAAAVALVAMGTAVVQVREKLYKDTYERAFANIDLLRRRQLVADEEHQVPEIRIYRDMQHAVPAGAPLAVLLDQPYLVSFTRNPIYNLDMPGYASPAPGLPFFQGTEKVEQYFKGLGVRYIAFVRPEYSRYHYRGEYWKEMVANEQEIWRVFTPYLLFFMDTLVDMAKRHKRLYEYRGIVVVDLEAAP